MHRFLSGLGQDLRYAVRQMRRSPGFAITALLTLALGIGATATMYSVVRDVLLAPLPYPESDRLVGIAFTYPQAAPNDEELGSGADFLREHTSSFASLGVTEDASTGANLSIAGGERTLRVPSTRVSQGYFPTLSLDPVLGRGFTPQEDLPGGPNVALLSYGVWQRTFNADPNIVNRVVRINEEPYTIVGVMPEGASASPESRGGANTAGVWLPLRLSARSPGYEGTNYAMVGRLCAGVSHGVAQHELDGLNMPFYHLHPGYRTWTNSAKALHAFRIWPLKDVLVSDVRQSLLVLFAAVLAVLLVACLNLAGLMTARAATRQRELALRTALGATRAGLLRLLASESLVLALAGGALGLLLAEVARPALLAAAPLSMPVAPAHGLAARWGVAGFVALIALATTLLCGLLPAWTVFRQDAQAGLRGGQAAGVGAVEVRTGKALMIGQVAVAMVLLSASTLLLATFLKLRAVNPGLEAKRLTVAQLSLKGTAYTKQQRTTQFVATVVASLGHTPGIDRVAAINGLPLDRGLNIQGLPQDQPEKKGNVEFRVVTPGYFRTLGIPLLAGRDLTDADRSGAVPVALISETTARRFWPDRSAIGERVVVGRDTVWTIVGVVADTRANSLAEPPQVTVYALFAQISDGMTSIVNGWFPTTFAIRTAADVDVAAAVRQAVVAADPEMPVARLMSMQEVIDDTVAAPRFFSWMAAGFAGFALLLTVIGLFGLLSYQVTQRTREIGVRLAIGASRRQVLGLILNRGMVLTACGLALGGVASLAMPRVVAGMLEDYVYTGGAGFGPGLANEAAALTLAALAMLLAAALASYLPARRAAAVEPVEALRAD